VLIVGDPQLARGLLQTLLTRLDYVVTAVSTGAEAIASLLTTPCGLVLIALRLPDMTGIALARRLASRRPDGSGVSTVVFGNAWDRDAVLRDCREAGVDAFLERPLSLTRLVAAVRELTHGARRSTGARPMSSHPVEMERLESFTEGDPGLQQELCELYLRTADGYLAGMATALHKRKDWGRLAHGLKGASANFGATAVAELAERAERLPPSADMLASIAGSLAQVRSFLERSLAQRPRQSA
jgi:CheY-like chemotaxis protein/HPt (histidine-containing phosphotransfer) domain-containing protein